MTTKILDETSFPLYCIQSYINEIFVVAGGGGAAKTGVKNAIHVYKLVRDGSSFTATAIAEVDTERRASMSLHLHPDRNQLAVGMDHLCQLYTMKLKKEKGFDKMIISASTSVNAVPPSIDDEGDYQKCVRFTLDKKFIITGGSDGNCKIFKLPSLEEHHQIKASTDEIDDLDVHPNSKYFVTTSKESSASLWRIKDGKKELELPYSIDGKDDDFYRFRNCRFSESKDTNKVYLYTTHTPKKYSKEKAANCLVRWDTHKWIPEHTVFIKKYTLSALAVSAIGRYLAVGTADGAIIVYTTWNMRHLKTVNNVHDIFVTGLSFVPENKLLCDVMKQDAAILSCSIDNKCQVTMIPSRSEFPMIVLLCLFGLVIVVLFNFITYFDFEF